MNQSMGVVFLIPKGVLKFKIKELHDPWYDHLKTTLPKQLRLLEMLMYRQVQKAWYVRSSLSQCPNITSVNVVKVLRRRRQGEEC